MKYNITISHVRPDGKIQSNEEHCHEVAKLAGGFAAEFGMREWGEILGVLHDKGKERDSFQRYIRHATSIDASACWKEGEDKNHAFIGAIAAKTIFDSGYQILSYPIMGHHSGLDDYMHFEDKMKNPIPIEIDLPQFKVNLSMPEAFKHNGFTQCDFHHVVRMLFSCLVDADRLDTERFMNEDSYNSRKRTTSLTDLALKLDHYLKNLKESSENTWLNKLRQDIQDRCAQTASSHSGFFSLTVPTGGGKTLSAIVWAIQHCLNNGQKRIIIAIPYTSIITQTAQKLKEIFGEENVLEHHSNFDPQSISDADTRRKMKLATENWDYPIIVTTNVQLFESIFSSQPSACRKLHNIVNSTVILDEVQTLPLEHLQPIIDCMDTYQRLFNVSFLFTTASLPTLKDDLICQKGISNKLKGLKNINEIIPDRWKLHDKLRRVNINFDNAACSYQELAERIVQHEKVLCIVNTRKEAKEIFNLLPTDDIKIHLSRMMCSAHIGDKIKELKHILKSNDCRIIRVVATQLIEAGVDIDFPVVYRQKTGLDSILQAAGRCNREGKLTIGDTYVFHFLKQKGVRMSGSRAWREYALDDMLGQTKDWMAPETMTEYFLNLYAKSDNFDKADIRQLLCDNLIEMHYSSASNAFNLIDDTGTKTVYVNYGISPTLIFKLQTDGPSYDLMKQLSRYSIGLHDTDFKELHSAGIIEEIIPQSGMYYISDKEQYKDDVGLVLENHWLEETLTI